MSGILFFIFASCHPLIQSWEFIFFKNLTRATWSKNLLVANGTVPVNFKLSIKVAHPKCLPIHVPPQSSRTWPEDKYFLSSFTWSSCYHNRLSFDLMDCLCLYAVHLYDSCAKWGNVYVEGDAGQYSDVFLRKVFIPKGFYSEQFLFRTVVFPKGFYSERCLLQKFGIKTFQNKKPFGEITVQIYNLTGSNYRVT